MPKVSGIKFIYFEKATKFCKISTLLLCYLVPVKSKMEISQNFVAFSEYMKFTYVNRIEKYLQCFKFFGNCWKYSIFFQKTGRIGLQDILMEKIKLCQTFAHMEGGRVMKCAEIHCFLINYAQCTQYSLERPSGYL